MIHIVVFRFALCLKEKKTNNVQCLWCIGDRDVLCYLLVDKQCQSSRDKELKREARYIEAACNELRREKHSCRQIRNHSFQLTQSLLELKSKNLEIQQILKKTFLAMICCCFCDIFNKNLMNQIFGVSTKFLFKIHIF